MSRFGRWIVVGVAFATGLFPVILFGQNDALSPGARIRFRAPSVTRGRQEAILVSRTSDSLVVATDTTTLLHLALADITDLEISKGKSKKLGAKKGFLWGAGLGLVSSNLVCDGPSCRFSALQRIGFSLYSAAVNGGLGALIGSRIGSNEWVPYQAPDVIHFLPP